MAGGTDAAPTSIEGACCKEKAMESTVGCWHSTPLRLMPGDAPVDILRHQIHNS